MDSLLMMAVLPVIVLLVYVYHKDPVEKEPLGLLAKLLLWGVASTLFAIVLEVVGSEVFLGGGSPETFSGILFENFLLVALVEEACKYFFLKRATWRHPAFDYAFDGIVYAVFVSLGFAVAENIGYVSEYGFETAVVRAFTAIPGHCVFAVFMGYFYAEAKSAEVRGDSSGRTANLALAVLVPTLLHGTYDSLASFDGMGALFAFYAFLIAMVVTGMYLVKRESALARRVYAGESVREDVMPR